MKLVYSIIFAASLVVSAQAQSGVLLGIHSSRAGSNESSYKTYWIIADAAGPRLAATLPDLVLPRKDGFWRVGVFTHSYSKRYEAGSLMDMPGNEARYFEDQESELYIVPVAQAPKVAITADDPQPASAKKEKPSGNNAQPAAEPAEEDDDSGQPCTTEDVAITYLNPQNIGLTQRSSQTEFCSPARYATFGSNELVSLDQAQAPPANEQTRGIVIMDLLPAAQKLTIRKEVSSDLDPGTKDFDVLGGVTLTLAHDQGNWELLAWRDGSVASRGGADFQLKVPAPATLVHAAHVSPALAAEMRSIKELKDFVVSPAGDLVITMVGQKLVAYRVVAGKLSAPAELAQPSTDDNAQAILVMAEWATGKWVAVWDKQLKNLKLPAVATRVIPH